jgi:pyruvate, orthophosphate dikinase
MPALEIQANKRRLARGLNASPGTATGRVVFSSATAVTEALVGPVILVRIESSAEDISGMRAAAGILTTRGGLTGDGAIVARSLGKPCVAGCTAVVVDYRAETMTIAVDDPTSAKTERVIVKRGDLITLDGTHGYIFEG